MNRSTFCEIKYMNRLVFFSKAGYMIRVGFKILTHTLVPKLPPPHTHTITEDIKGHTSSKNTIWIGQLSVKSSIWIGWVLFQRSGIWLGLVAEYWLAHPYQNYPKSPPPEFETFSLSVYVNCVQLYSLPISCPNYAQIQWKKKYHLELLYSDEAHPTACAMLETGAMSIRRTSKPF